MVSHETAKGGEAINKEGKRKVRGWGREELTFMMKSRSDWLVRGREGGVIPHGLGRGVGGVGG